MANELTRAIMANLTAGMAPAHTEPAQTEQTDGRFSAQEEALLRQLISADAAAPAAAGRQPAPHAITLAELARLQKT